MLSPHSSASFTCAEREERGQLQKLPHKWEALDLLSPVPTSLALQETQHSFTSQKLRALTGLRPRLINPPLDLLIIP